MESTIGQHEAMVGISPEEAMMYHRSNSRFTSMYNDSNHHNMDIPSLSSLVAENRYAVLQQQDNDYYHHGTTTDYMHPELMMYGTLPRESHQFAASTKNPCRYVEYDQNDIPERLSTGCNLHATTTNVDKLRDGSDFHMMYGVPTMTNIPVHTDGMIVQDHAMAMSLPTPPVVPKKKKGWKKPSDMPKRPMSSYNLYFQLERERIINDLPETIYTMEDVDRIATLCQMKDEMNMKSMIKRKHRKSHGKISFAKLARVIADQWKVLPSNQKDLFYQRAQIEKMKYQRAVDIWTKSKQQQQQQVKHGSSNSTSSASSKQDIKDEESEHSSSKKQESRATTPEQVVVENAMTKHAGVPTTPDREDYGNMDINKRIPKVTTGVSQKSLHLVTPPHKRTTTLSKLKLDQDNHTMQSSPSLLQLLRSASRKPTQPSKSILNEEGITQHTSASADNKVDIEQSSCKVVIEQNQSILHHLQQQSNNASNETTSCTDEMTYDSSIDEHMNDYNDVPPPIQELEFTIKNKDPMEIGIRQLRGNHDVNHSLYVHDDDTHGHQFGTLPNQAYDEYITKSMEDGMNDIKYDDEIGLMSFPLCHNHRNQLHGYPNKIHTTDLYVHPKDYYCDVPRNDKHQLSRQRFLKHHHGKNYHSMYALPTTITSRKQPNISNQSLVHPMYNQVNTYDDMALYHSSISSNDEKVIREALLDNLLREHKSTYNDQRRLMFQNYGEASIDHEHIDGLNVPIKRPYVGGPRFGSSMMMNSRYANGNQNFRSPLNPQHHDGDMTDHDIIQQGCDDRFVTPIPTKDTLNNSISMVHERNINYYDGSQHFSSPKSIIQQKGQIFGSSEMYNQKHMDMIDSSSTNNRFSPRQIDTSKHSIMTEIAQLNQTSCRQELPKEDDHQSLAGTESSKKEVFAV